jgi:hypothetical protein
MNTEVDAEQFFHGQDPETYPECVRWDETQGAYVIDTPAGPMILHDGGYIITSASGDRYPVEREVFEANYRKASSTTP